MHIGGAGRSGVEFGDGVGVLLRLGARVGKDGLCGAFVFAVEPRPGGGGTGDAGAVHSLDTGEPDAALLGSEREPAADHAITGLHDRE